MWTLNPCNIYFKILSLVFWVSSAILRPPSCALMPTVVQGFFFSLLELQWNSCFFPHPLSSPASSSATLHNVAIAASQHSAGSVKTHICLPLCADYGRGYATHRPLCTPSAAAWFSLRRAAPPASRGGQGRPRKALSPFCGGAAALWIIYVTAGGGGLGGGGGGGALDWAARVKEPPASLLRQG